MTECCVALKATIFKADISIADVDRNYYASHSLTLARHPSETDERMMVRLLAFALNASERLQFGRGLSAEDEPDLWAKDLTGAIDLWIDVGQPGEKEVRKACGRAKAVKVYTYGGRSQIWWRGVQESLERSKNLEVIDIPGSRNLTSLAMRSMSLQCSIQDGTALVSDDKRSVEIEPKTIMTP